MEAIVRKKSGEKSISDLRNKFEQLNELIKTQAAEQELLREELNELKVKLEAKGGVTTHEHPKGSHGTTPPNECDSNLEDKLCQHQDVLRQLGIQMVTLDGKVLNLTQQLPKINQD